MFLLPFPLLDRLLLTVSLAWGLLRYGFVAAVSLSSSGFSVSIDGISYFVSPYTSGKVSLDELDLLACVSVGGLYPITVLSNVTVESNFSVLMERFIAEDDVFQIGFLQSM